MPNHEWKTYRIGDITFESKVRAKDVDAAELSVYGVDNKIGLNPTPRYVADSLERYKVIENGMFAYNPMRLNIGSIGYSFSNMPIGLVSPDYVVFGCKSEVLLSDYLHHYTKTQLWADQMENAGSGSVRFRIYYDSLAGFPISIPPLEEQRKIAAILSTWDEAIGLVEQLIAALGRRKQALMQLLLTGAVRFAGFEGEWETVEIKSLGKVITGNTPATSNPEYYGDEYLFVSPADLGDEKYIVQSAKRLSALGYKTTRQIRKGSTLFTCIGSTIGKTGLAGVDMATNQQINSVVPSKEFDDEYVYYALSNISSRIAMFAGKQAVPIVNKTSFENEVLFAPLDTEEQAKIGVTIGSIDELIYVYIDYAKFLKEQKRGLMQQLLTGAVRVNRKENSSNAY